MAAGQAGPAADILQPDGGVPAQAQDGGEAAAPDPKERGPVQPGPTGERPRGAQWALLSSRYAPPHCRWDPSPMETCTS
jgi:hypothetical protein